MTQTQTAAATLQAAIDKMEALKEQSQGDYWYRSIGGVSVAGGEFGASPVSLLWAQSGRRLMGQPQATEVDAELIVTLHRTIDAQLAILRTSLTLDGLVPMDQVLDLARAILAEA